ncbi:MAG: ABC transporter permease, partial [Alistipes sp.]|nr:ABC transporter permease [Alistipes sp.]
MIGKIFSRGYLLLLLAMLYAPIVVIAVFSFTEAKVLGNWTGFSTGIYESLFSGKNVLIMRSIENTLIIAVVAAAIATLLGTIAAIGIYNMRHRQRRIISFVNNIPMLNPDIITGVSLFILFVFMGVTQGYTTVTLAHVTFCTPYVVLS